MIQKTLPIVGFACAALLLVSCDKLSNKGDLQVQNTATHADAVVTVTLDGEDAVTLNPGDSHTYKRVKKDNHALLITSSGCDVHDNNCTLWVTDDQTTIVQIEDRSYMTNCAVALICP